MASPWDQWDETNGGSLVAATVTTVTIAAIFVGLRFYTRIRIVRTLGPSDWAIFLALIFSIGNTACTLHQIRLGTLGRHSWTVRYPYPSIEGMKTLYAANIFYPATLMAVKLSILILYLRILSPIFLHRVCYATIGLVVVGSGFSLITAFSPCVPVVAYWDGWTHPGAWCWPSPVTWINIGFHMFTEVVILVLPMPFLLSLEVPWRRKIGVILLFAFGLIVIVVGAVRIPIVVTIYKSLDPTWDAVPIGIWSSIELNTAIGCACAMTLKPLINRVFPRLFTDDYNRQDSKEDVTHDGSGGAGGGHPLTIGRQRNRRIAPDDALALETLGHGHDMPKGSHGSELRTTTSASSPSPEPSDVEQGQSSIFGPDSLGPRRSR